MYVGINMVLKKDEALWVMGSKVNVSLRLGGLGQWVLLLLFLTYCWWFQLGICTLKEDRVGNILKGR